MDNNLYYIYKVKSGTIKQGHTYRFLYNKQINGNQTYISKYNKDLDKLIDFRDSWLSQFYEKKEN